MFYNFIDLYHVNVNSALKLANQSIHFMSVLSVYDTDTKSSAYSKGLSKYRRMAFFFF